jgi:hypothetical protein
MAKGKAKKFPASGKESQKSVAAPGPTESKAFLIARNK